MPRVFLVNPALTRIGYSFITPRWLFVLAQATPECLVGDPILVDETIERFEPETVRPGDVVGLGINSRNCVAGYRVLQKAKARGATVIVGGIHATILPDEPLEMGADAVVTGNGDIVWRRVVEDALNGRLQKRYIGGRVPGDQLLKARWELLDSNKYLMASLQTIAGCPENCSFCSVWVTDGRQPRRRLTEKIIEEANELYDKGFRYILFADDNFNPATIGRIAREPSVRKRQQLELIREERLKFFEEYDRRVPRNLFAFTQMTAEVLTDEEYLSAMYRKMRVRTALIGVESFTREGLESTNKQWNPVGQAMVETIQKIQSKGILVLSSIICGLESDTKQSLRTMSEFARNSGSILAQFPIYVLYPGTKDYYDLTKHLRRRDSDRQPKDSLQVLEARYWLSQNRVVDQYRHPYMSKEELLAENRRCWDDFYSLREILRRLRQGVARSWPLAGRLTYILLCLVFKRVYQGDGVSADCVQKKKGLATRLLIQLGAGIYNHYFRQKRVGIHVLGRGRPHVAAKIMETRIRSMRKDARLSDQVTAGTGSRVAEGCLKQGHLHLAAEPDLSSCDSWRTFLLKRRWWSSPFRGRR
jgi:radical SAM superfamily enzyme YgiQ (UPF0313 family)